MISPRRIGIRTTGFANELYARSLKALVHCLSKPGCRVAFGSLPFGSGALRITSASRMANRRGMLVMVRVTLKVSACRSDRWFRFFRSPRRPRLCLSLTRRVCGGSSWGIACTTAESGQRIIWFFQFTTSTITTTIVRGISWSWFQLPLRRSILSVHRRCFHARRRTICTATSRLRCQYA